jgi:hypothetical protein
MEDVEKMHSDLLEGRVSRRQASDWAAQWVMANVPYVNDDRVWRALTHLVRADMLQTDRPYLYGERDFEAWLNEFRNPAQSG